MPRGGGVGATGWARREAATLWAIAVSVAIAAAFFFWTFPLDFFLGRAAFWNNPGDDPAQALNGYLAFAHDGWHFPLFRTTLMDPLAGANIIFTDPIPLAALLGKIFYKASGILINYFGYWLFFCYVMQAVAAILLARTLKVVSFIALLSIGVIFLFTPSFLFRYGHDPLCAHFLLLLSIALYLRIVERPTTWLLTAFSSLFLLTFLINAYLFAMVGAIYLASLADAALRRTLAMRSVAITAALTLVAAILLIAFCGGAQLGAAVGIIDGFGFYSMNFLSPIWPQLSGIFSWARGFIDATGGQYEGFNYLGAGVLALCLLALVLNRRGVAKTVSAHPFFAVATILMALYALSFQVWVGSVRLIHFHADAVPIFRSIAGTFRSSGRFFWPLGYAIMIAVIALTIRALPRRPAMVVLALAAMVQTADALGVRPTILQRLHVAAPPLDRAVWAGIVKQHRAVIVEPHFICMAADDREVHREILLIAGADGVPANSAILNRPSVDCEAERNAVMADPFAEPFGSPALHLFMKGVFSPTLLSALKPSGMNCAEAGFGIVCSGAKQPGFTIGAAGFAPMIADRYRIGATLDLADGGGGLEFLDSGWSMPEAWGVWAVDGPVQFVLPLTAAPDGDLEFSADIHPFDDGRGYLVRRAAIQVNGQHIADLTLAAPGEQHIRFLIPAALAASDPVLTITFLFAPAKSPEDLHLSIDRRHLTWGFRRFAVTRALP